MSFSKCSPSMEHKTPLCFHIVETMGMFTLLALGIVLLSHTTQRLWGSHEHMITAGLGKSTFTSPPLGLLAHHEQAGRS